MACSPFISWLILQGYYDYAAAAALVAGLSDFADGYIAKNYNQASIIGGFLDPLADKVLVAALAVPLSIQGHIPPPLAIICVARDILLIAGAVTKQARTKPNDAPFFDMMAFTTMQIAPSKLSKVNTALQFCTLTLAITRALASGFPPDVIFYTLCWLTGGTTIASGLGYILDDGTKLLTSRARPAPASKQHNEDRRR